MAEEEEEELASRVTAPPPGVFVILNPVSGLTTH